MTKERRPTDEQIPDLVVGATPNSSRQKREQPAFDPQDFELEIEGIGQPSPHIVEEPSRPWPAAQTPERVALDAEAIQRACPYGAPPEHLFEAPIYAWLVFREQSKLKRGVLAAQLRLEQAERERDATLARWMDSVSSSLAQDERFARLFEALTSEESGLDLAKRDIERTEADIARDQQAGDQEASELQVQIDVSAAESQAKAAWCTDAERALAREQAKRKRIDIEARASSGLDTGQYAARIADVEQAVAAAEVHLEHCRQNLAVAERSHEALRLELRRFEDRKRRTAIVVAQQQQRVHAELTATERTLTQKKADIGRAVLSLRDPKHLDDRTWDLLLRHDRDVLELAAAHQLLMIQLDGFDRQAVQRGLWLALGTLGLGLLLALVGVIC